ncbi:MAG: VWA domain-containing protein [Clostridium sp.]|nr:MAG: VWA domain-containing protein [Clostridium sp.]
MSGNSRLYNLKTVSKEMVKKLNLENSTVSIITFESSASTILSYSNNQSSIDSAINSLSASGGTSFLSAIGQTASFLQTSVNDKDNYVIFLSDGDSADTPRSSDVDYIKNKAKVYTIGIGGAVASQLIPLATSRDNYYSYDDVSDSDSLNGLYKNI